MSPKCIDLRKTGRQRQPVLNVAQRLSKFISRHVPDGQWTQSLYLKLLTEVFGSPEMATVYQPRAMNVKASNESKSEAPPKCGPSNRG
jgi:hypothetical protein